jgi:hypothetical protein
MTGELNKKYSNLESKIIKGEIMRAPIKGENQENFE